MKPNAKLEKYRPFAPQGTLESISAIAEQVEGTTFLNVNSTRIGGGVAEILYRLIPLLEEVGVKTRWDVITGGDIFFETTKGFHNALQGIEQHITKEMFEAYLAANEENAKNLDLDADVALIHDPQPAALIPHKPAEAQWVWRCHIDMSKPQRNVWRFLRPYVLQYQATVFSLPKFAQRLPIPQFLIYPSIDPLSDKNRNLEPEEQQKLIEELGLPLDKPILLQVSRFDRFKDPIGVIEAYKMVKKTVDCRLVLAGGGATDDPEGAKVLSEVRSAADGDPDILIYDLPPTAHLQINALQRAATIILQKSVREGFGLTVSEAMWKGKPVIGGAVGGIAVQIVQGVTGFLVHSVEGAAFRIRYLLNHPQVMEQMGKDAREFVRQNFLITRHMRDYLGIVLVMRHLEEARISLWAPW
jgi:trehalose synthase